MRAPTVAWLLVACASGELPSAGAAPGPAWLPPELPWSGASQGLVVPGWDPWITPAEASSFERTPSYDETLAYLRRLVAATPHLSLRSLGQSAHGRRLWAVLASQEGAKDLTALRANGRPTLLAQAGIHAGEIDGKDAGLMLLRDLTVRAGTAKPFAGVNFVLIPILNADGHERRSPFGRVNQRGPRQMGWRTNARNLNLNRDYAKLDTPELRALVRALNELDPTLYLDLHVTDGADYQYDITYGWNGPHGYSPAIAAWLDEVWRPQMVAELEDMGHQPGPLIFAKNQRDFADGIVEWSASPRYSNGYGDARHLPTILVENHSLKAYGRRVLGTYVLLRSTLELLAKRGRELDAKRREDRARRPTKIPLSFEASKDGPGQIELLAVSSELVLSPVSGRPEVRWTGQPRRMRVPLHRMTTPARAVVRPRAYWIPAAYPDVIERVVAHGIRIERIDEARTVAVEMYRTGLPQFAKAPYEGRLRVSAETEPELHQELFAPGSVRVSTDQPLGNLAVLLLEPGASDSFFQWGFFSQVLNRSEYIEGYVIEPLARQMLQDDPELHRAFLQALEDPELAADPSARLRWFYERTPYVDERHRLLPVARER